jgi:pimeloyl-ACP methyl ester carboxylesterase
MSWTRLGDVNWSYATERVETVDGWDLLVHHLEPARPSSDVPVLFIHGHGTTGRSFLGLGGRGLAGALAAAGRDVWLAELRGSLGTHRTGSRWPTTRRRPRGRARVCVRDKLGVDLPAILDHLRARTQSPLVDAVAHSLGGVFVYLHGLTARSPVIRRAVTIGSPLAIPPSAIPAPLRSLPAGLLAGRLGRLALRGLSSRVVDRARVRWMPVHFDPEEADDAEVRQFLRHGVADVYGTELAEILRWVRSADPFSLAPPGRALPRRARLPFPVRFLVGAADPLTTPESVMAAYRRVGNGASDIHVLGRASGFTRDYRHADILVGRNVHRDVAPLLIEWLADERSEAVAEIVPFPKCSKAIANASASAPMRQNRAASG